MNPKWKPGVTFHPWSRSSSAPKCARRLPVQNARLLERVADVETQRHALPVRIEIGVLHAARLHEIETSTKAPDPLGDNCNVPAGCCKLKYGCTPIRCLVFVLADQPRRQLNGTRA